MQKLSKTMLRLFSCMFFLQVMQVHASNNHGKKASLDMISLGTKAGIIALIASGAQGIYNIRHYERFLRQLQLDYNFKHPVYVMQYPATFIQNVICSNLPELSLSHQQQYGLSVIEINKKIAVFESSSAHSNAIWDFERFKNMMPHTNTSSGGYSISKNYLGSFGYSTLGLLKQAIAFQIEKAERDFKELTKLTDLTWYFLDIPKNAQEYALFEERLDTFSDYYGAYTFLGFFGYSSVHNSVRIKTYLRKISKIHMFLLNLQELLATSVDSDSTQIIQASGAIQFSLQNAPQRHEMRDRDF